MYVHLAAPLCLVLQHYLILLLAVYDLIGVAIYVLLSSPILPTIRTSCCEAA